MRKLNPGYSDRAPTKPDEVSLFFERLEPKILFSADALAGLAAVDPLDGNNLAGSGLDIDQSAQYLTEAYTPSEIDSDHQQASSETQPLQLDALQAALEDRDPAKEEQATDDTLETFLQDSVTPMQERQEVIFVDAATPDYEQLLGTVKSEAPETDYLIFLLQSDRDGIEQINVILDGLEGIDAMHLVSHGNESGFQLGDSWLDRDALAANANLFSGWSSALREDADILIYGCNLAAGEAGLQLIDDLAELTGADVAASTDLTGDADQGGDWDLEHRSGQVETEVAFGSGVQTAWKGLLLNTGTAIWTDSTTNPEEVITDDWDGSSFSGTTSSGAVVDHYAIIQAAEAPGRDERIVVGVQRDNHVGGIIWDGASWSAIPSTALGGNTGPGDWWSVDVAYEQHSGDAVIVYNDGTELRYSVWDGSSWTTESALVAAFTGAEPEHMHLVASPGTDEMILVVNDRDDAHHALVWNGSSWGNAITLDTSGNNDTDKTALNAVYEQTSGRAMVVYGTDGSTDLNYRIWDGSAWDAGPTAITIPGDGAAGQAQWVTLDSDPTSNRLILGVTTDGSDSWASIWDGSSWSQSITVSTALNGSNFQGADVAFESQSGQAMIAYGEAGAIKYMTWSSGSGWSTPTDAVVLAADANAVLLESAPSDNQIMLSVQDNDQDISYALWNGTAWGAPDELGIESGENRNQPFVFLWDQDNLAPTATNLNSASTYNEGDAIVPITDIVVSDADSGETITATLTLANTATGSLTTGSFGTATSSYTAATGVWQVTGSLTDVNAALAAVAFVPTTDNDLDTTITSHIADAAGTGPADGIITLDVAPANDAPKALNLSSVSTYNEGDAFVPLTDIIVSDVDTDETITAILTLANTAAGSLTTGTFGTATSTYTAATGTWQVTGSVTEVNLALAAVAFVPTSDNDEDTKISTHIEDAAGLAPADGIITLNVTPANDAPTATNLSSTASYTEGDVSVAITDIVVSDVDTGETITAVLTLADTATGSLSANDGASYDGGTGSWTITGTVTQVNTALANLVFNPATDNDLDTSIAVSIDDGDEDGSGALTGSIDLNVTPVNDAPTAADSTVSADEDVAYVFSAPDFGFADPEGDALDRIRVTTLESSGSLQLDGVDVVLNQVISRADIDAGKLTFTSAPHEYGASYDSFGFQVHDGTEFSLTSYTMTVDVAPVNDVPVANAGPDELANEGHSHGLDAGGSTDAEGTALTEITPDGGEQQLNTSGAGDQKEVDIAIAADGSYVAVWEGLDADLKGVFVQRFNADGTPDGGEVLVNTATVGDQKKPRIAMADDGSYVIAWEGLDADLKGIFAQRFDANGNTIGTEFRVNTETTGDQKSVDIDMMHDGRFIIAWETLDADKKGVFAQLYDASGSAVGGEFQVNTTEVDDQKGPAVGMASDGSFVIAWEGKNDGDLKGVFAQRFDSNGDFLGREFRVNTTIVGDQKQPDIAVGDDGSFLIAWTSSDGDEKGIYAQRFDNDGVAVGAEFQVNELTAGNQDRPTIGMLDDGSAIILWDSPDASDKGVSAIRIDADNNKIGSQFQVNTTTLWDQKHAAVDINDDGEIVVAWESGEPESKDVFAQRYDSVNDLSYTWTQVSGPPVTLSDANSARPMFFVPEGLGGPPPTIEFQVEVSDGEYSSTDTVVVTVNRSPTSADHLVTIDEDTDYTFLASDFAFNDVDPGDLFSGIQVSTLAAAGSLQLSGVDVSADQLISKADIDAGKLKFVPDPDANGVGHGDFGFRVSDGHMVSLAEYTMSIDVTPVQDAPTATNLSSTSAYNEGDVNVAITDIVVSDVDTGEIITALLTLADTATGSLSANDGASYDSATGVWTITGTVAQVNTALANLVFNPATDNDLNTSIDVNIDDGDEDGSGALTGSITLNVSASNDAPTATNLSSTSAYNEDDVSVPITDIVVGDVDTGETITATLTLADTATGSLSANDGASYDSLSGIWTITGTVAQVNTALANLVFNPAADNDLDTTITTHIEDAAGTGPADGSITLTVTPANDAPTATNLSSTSTYNEDDASVPITNIVVADVDTGETITATLTLADTATGSLSANDGASYDGLSGIWTITGSVAQVNTALANLVFNPASNNEVDTTITTHVEDAAGTGPADGSITLTVTPANDAPTATNLSSTSTYNEDDASVPITNIVVADVDTGETITATLTLADTSTGSLSANDGASYDSLTGTWSITGTVAQVNTALANLVFNPASNNEVDTTITTHVEDTAGAGPADGTITLVVTPVNDAPMATNLSSTSTYNEGDASVPITDIVVSDIDNGETITAVLTLADTSAGSLSANDGASYDGLTGIWTITGTVAQVNTALANLVFNPAADNDVDTTITTHIEDAAGSGPVDGSISLNVKPANDAPTASNLSSTSSYVEGVPSVAIADIVVSDVDTGDTVTATLTLADTSTGSLSANDGSSYDSLTGVWSISGSVAQVNTALANLVFNPAADNDVDTTITTHIEDAAGEGPADGTINLNVAPANEAPTATNLISAAEYTEGDASVPLNDIVISDANTGETLTATLILANPMTGSLSANDGASYDAVGGVWTITGTVSQLNTALANLEFIPAANNTLDASVAISIDDGDEDSSGPLIGAMTITVNPLPVVELAAPPVVEPPAPPAPIEEFPSAEPRAEAEITVEAAPGEVSAEETASETTAILDSESSVTDRLPSPVRAEPSQSVLTDTDRESEQPRDRDRVADSKGNQPVKAEVSKPVGVEVLQQRLREQIEFFDDPLQLTAAETFITRLDDMRDELVEETEDTEKVIGSSLSISAGFSVGYVIWLARSGILLSSVLSSLPAWRFIDPLPVLGALHNRNDDDDAESLESLVESNAARETGQPDLADGKAND